MTIVIPSSSAEIIADPARFLADLRAGHAVYLADLGGSVALAEVDGEVEDMVSLRSEKTGVDNTIFVSTKGYAEHAPRIKIAVDPPHSFTLVFEPAYRLTVFDETPQYESFSVHLNGRCDEYV